MNFLHLPGGILLGYSPDVLRDLAVTVGWGLVFCAFVIVALRVAGRKER